MLLLLELSLAVGGISMILARSRLFREARWWAHRHLGEFAWDFSKCPWCLSVWLAFLAAWLYGPVVRSNHPLIDWFVTAMVIVALAPIPAILIYRGYGPLPPVPTEAEWAAGEPEEGVHQ